MAMVIYHRLCVFTGYETKVSKTLEGVYVLKGMCRPWSKSIPSCQFNSGAHLLTFLMRVYGHTTAKKCRINRVLLACHICKCFATLWDLMTRHPIASWISARIHSWVVPPIIPIDTTYSAHKGKCQSSVTNQYQMTFNCCHMNWSLPRDHGIISDCCIF